MRLAFQILFFLMVTNLSYSQNLAIKREFYNGDSCYIYDFNHNYRTHFAFYIKTKKQGNAIAKFPYDGKWIEFSWKDTTKVSRFFEIKNGLPNGIYLRYSDDGELKDSGQYFNGARSGLWSLKEDDYKQNVYCSFGNYAPVDTFYFNPGHSIDWYKDGLWTYRNYSGLIVSKEFYKKGWRDSIWTSYYSNGRMKIQEQFKDGRRYGEYYEWDENGILQTRMTYLDNGNCITYYDTGEKFGEGKMDEYRYYTGSSMIKKGEWTYYYKDGNIWAKGSYEFFESYIQGMIAYIYPHSGKSGLWEFWYPNGQKLAHGKFMLTRRYSGPHYSYDCVMIGKWSYYSETGVKIKPKDFENTELIKIKEPYNSDIKSRY